MEKPLFHGDIKPANILLDGCLEPKIGDFGLSREGQLNVDMEVSRIVGTCHYLPVDYIKNKILSPKVDVYSYGIVLYEIASTYLIQFY